MSLRPQPPLPPVPDDTARVARAAFRRGNPYVLLRDRLGAVFADADFADLYPALGQPGYAPWRLAPVTRMALPPAAASAAPYPALGQPGYAPWRLALVTRMQFREGLSDRQAADAVRG